MLSRILAVTVLVLVLLLAVTCHRSLTGDYIAADGQADLMRTARTALSLWSVESRIPVSNLRFSVLRRDDESATVYMAFDCQEQPHAPWVGYEGQVALVRSDGRWQLAEDLSLGPDSSFLPRQAAAGTRCVCSIAFSPDGTHLATGGMDRTVRLWDVAGLRQEYAFEAGGERSCGVAFSPDGALLAAAGEGPITLHDPANGRQITALESEDAVFGLAFSPDGKRLVSGSADTSVKLWDVESRQVAVTLCQGPAIARAVAYAPDGRTVASGCRDGVVRIWSVPDGTVAREMSHPEAVLAMAYSPDSRLLATGGQGRAVQVWEAETGRKLYMLSRHTDWIIALAFSPDGTLIASGSRDGTVRLWRVTDGREVRVMGNEDDSVRSLAFSPDGTLLAVGSADGTLWLWRIK